MFTRKSLTTFVFVLFALAAGVAQTAGQTATTFVTGLKSPVKIIYAEDYGVFFVSEAGLPTTVNSGRISIVGDDGSLSTLIDGLPSGPAPPGNEPSGPSALWLDGDTLYVAIGNGNSTLAGPAPGSEIPNPNPASPIFSSVLELRLPAPRRLGRVPYQLEPEDQARLANGATVNLGSGNNRIALRLTANFPDFTPAFRPDVPNNVRPSNPFGLVGAGNRLYVADAAQNNILTINLLTGRARVFHTFAPRLNPLPIGAPVIDPVPDSLRLFGNSLLVTFLTGFPFPAGAADVRQLNLRTGEETQFIGGLSSAIDVLPVINRGAYPSAYTLEFSTNMLMTGAPGRLRRFDLLGGTSTVISNSLVTPTSLALHSPSGDLLVTEIFPGRITRISFP